jgi:hypothetical protein
VRRFRFMLRVYVAQYEPNWSYDSAARAIRSNL